MGLKLLSVDGLVIRKVRHYVLKCHACFKYAFSQILARQLILISNNTEFVKIWKKNSVPHVEIPLYYVTI